MLVMFVAGDGGMVVMWRLGMIGALYLAVVVAPAVAPGVTAAMAPAGGG